MNNYEKVDLCYSINFTRESKDFLEQRRKELNTSLPSEVKPFEPFWGVILRITNWFRLLTNKKIFSCMNIYVKLGVGLLTGLAVIASLGGFKKNSKKNDSDPEDYKGSCGIPDEILDGNLRSGQNQQREMSKAQKYQRESEKSIRTTQQVLTQVSGTLETLSVIVSGILKLFCYDSNNRISPSTYIY